ncbi:LAQU0S01e08240g1_1 [Lachancea quebecensis]|uniref:LAQU0S01e08240g1_1 n=1 Tax=Lachancea quebecensis TaxID=1654605 RepID=A0A0N7MKV2_9SACH|nr:LAQU0S01e08240g1_1 [Lachancea quebecensis]
MSEFEAVASGSSNKQLPTLIDFKGYAGGGDQAVAQSRFTDKYPVSYHQIVEQQRALLDARLRPVVKNVGPSDSKRKVGVYSLVRRIGKGQFGDVYMANTTHGGHVAIKCVPKKPRKSQQYSMNQVLRQIRRQQSQGRRSLSSDEAILEMNVNKIRWEIFVASGLGHKNILGVIECLDSRDSKDIWIVLPFASLGELKWKRSSKAETLEQWDLALRHKSSVTEFSEYALRSLAAGLLYLSEQGCIHRDIKPSNILIDGSTGNIMLSDFGSSLLSPKKLSLEEPGMQKAYLEELRKIVGTPAFIAPELCNFEENDSSLDGFKIDIWSLGVTIFCLIENRLPFWGENEFDTFQKIANDELPLSGDWLHDLVVSKLLRKDPAQRLSIKQLDFLLRNPKKESGMKKLVSRLRKISMKKKKGTKVPEASTKKVSTIEPINAEFSDVEFSDIESNMSSTGSLSDEPVQVPGFMDYRPVPGDGSPSVTVSELSSRATPLELSPQQPSPLPVTPKHTAHDTSPSPIKIDTPLKNLIRAENTPEKAPSLTSTPILKPPAQVSQQANRLASKGTLDFTKYLQSPSKVPKDCVPVGSTKTSNSIEDIKRYLNFAES